MNAPRPPVRLTARVLSYGSLTAAVILGVGLVLDFVGIGGAGAFVGNIGVIALLLAPVAGLVATWSELKLSRPTHAWMAIAVLGVLGLATLIALLVRP